MKRWMIGMLCLTGFGAVVGVVHAQRLGVASCAQSFCHGSAKPLAATRVQQNEYITWLNFDPHARAYATLRNAKSRAIARRLGLGDAYEEKVCLDCHTDYVPRADRGPKFQIDDGIGCEACHGSASGWIAPHHSGSDKSHASNIQRGLAALERPEMRAEVCMSCHLGSRSRFASHTMMAAGHPRLSFELDTFTEIWRTSGGREHYRRDSNTASASRTWLRGLVKSATVRLDLVDAHGKGKGVMPEFAVYNCYACHRQMRVEAWAGPQTDDLAPGSLRFDDSALRVLIATFDGARKPIAQQLRAATRQWQKSLNNPQQLAIAQQDLRRVLAAGSGEIAGMNFSAAQSKAMLDSLVAAAQRGEFPDYASAEQAAMAMVLLTADSGSDTRHRPDVDKLFRALEDDSRFDPKLFRSIGAAAR